MVPEYADPESIPFLKSIPRSILSRFRAICHRYGTFTESKIVNLYRTSGISTMLYVYSVRYARCARYGYSFSCQSKRRLL